VRLYHTKTGKPQIVVPDSSTNASLNMMYHTKKVFVDNPSFALTSAALFRSVTQVPYLHRTFLNVSAMQQASIIPYCGIIHCCLSYQQAYKMPSGIAWFKNTFHAG
jgi:hypothetical protein